MALKRPYSTLRSWCSIVLISRCFLKQSFLHFFLVLKVNVSFESSCCFPLSNHLWLNFFLNCVISPWNLVSIFMSCWSDSFKISKVLLRSTNVNVEIIIIESHFSMRVIYSCWGLTPIWELFLNMLRHSYGRLIGLSCTNYSLSLVQLLLLLLSIDCRVTCELTTIYMTYSTCCISLNFLCFKYFFFSLYSSVKKFLFRGFTLATLSIHSLFNYSYCPTFSSW